MAGNSWVLWWWLNHFIPYLATRHRMFTKVSKLLWLTVYSIIVGGYAPSSKIPSSVSMFTLVCKCSLNNVEIMCKQTLTNK